jgi:hypothetical protein
MRLMTIGEMCSSLSGYAREESLNQYAEELGLGWRFWATLDLFIVVAALVLLVCGFRGVAILLIALGAFAPLAMTGGYLFGGLWRGYSIQDVLKHAYCHFK